ncbi:hypothetical protein MSG28_015309 [Choristoneura fumiferana]|uniref:Uncharacterized protein n=1 Tax=Choristoneura fumiferana TaxID=7141 RepID=A0ACC0KB04_CHOFU|nr:hypothetical protein MSG28_015309 [Choristoneura fumiferana]
MAVAMSRVEDVCRWCSSTLDQVLDSGDQLYQDSYLHYRPRGTSLLAIEQVGPLRKYKLSHGCTEKETSTGNRAQILRKFYTPGNCVCRVVVYQPRQSGSVDTDLVPQLTEFFREERSGVFVAGLGDFAVALFRTPRGFYMFDPADRDRYGRAVPPPCTGRARACFSQYPSVQALAEKLCPNIPPITKDPDDAENASKADNKSSKVSRLP